MGSTLSSLSSYAVSKTVETCIGNGGALVHSSFVTNCFFDSLQHDINYKKVEFFGIPQCVPESCELKEAEEFWKENILFDFKELGFQMDECNIKFKVDTKLPKTPKSPKSKRR